MLRQPVSELEPWPGVTADGASAEVQVMSPAAQPPAVSAAEPELVLPEPLFPEPVVPEPVVPEPVLPESVLPEPVLPEPVVSEAVELVAGSSEAPAVALGTAAVAMVPESVALSVAPTLRLDAVAESGLAVAVSTVPASAEVTQRCCTAVAQLLGVEDRRRDLPANRNS